MLSVVIPIHNEELSVLALYDRLTSVLESLAQPYEIIFVDDASTDRSFALLANPTDGGSLRRFPRSPGRRGCFA
jgi:glycosyltransferase involved in cell wall biosynthesis